MRDLIQVLAVFGFNVIMIKMNVDEFTVM